MSETTTPLPPEIVTALDEVKAALRDFVGEVGGVYNGMAHDALARDRFSERVTAAILRSLVAAKESAERDTETIMQEAFVTGRIYAAMGEKETPVEINAKLRENCAKALQRAAARAGEGRDHAD